MASRRRRGLGADYFEDVAAERRQAVEEKPAPKANPPAPQKRGKASVLKKDTHEKATFHLRRDLLEELRAASLELPPRVLGGSLSELVERALEAKLEELRRKHHGGEPFESTGEPVRRGRPPKR